MQSNLQEWPDEEESTMLHKEMQLLEVIILMQCEHAYGIGKDTRDSIRK